MLVKPTGSFSALGGLVYSTESGRHCAGCGKPSAECSCRNRVVPTGDGMARVRRETKGRGGKTVTTVSGLVLADSELKELVSALKRRCGCGGTLKDGVIEIQGEHVQLLIDELGRRGIQARKAGG